jgi:CelD/BcsL family acetyltransferase involved in cellulose biosynthesis
MLTVEEITSLQEFESLGSMWTDLTAQIDEPSPFLSHEWFQCCLEGFGEGKQLRIILVRDESRLIAVAPFWQYDETKRGIRHRVIGFVSSLDTPFVDLIVLPKERERALIAILDYLIKRQRRSWDLLVANQWPTESPNFRLLTHLLNRSDSRHFSGISSVTPYLSIAGDWDSFLSTRSQRFRKTYRNNVNRIKKLGDIEVQCIRRDDQKVHLAEMFAVAERGWKQEEGIGMASATSVKRFFARLTEVASARNWLLMWILRVQGAPVATEYDLVWADRVYALRSDFDESYREASPGAYLEYQVLQWMFKEGYRAYFTGPGLNAYKLRWTEQTQENRVVNICNNSARGRYYWLIEGNVVPFFRDLRDKAIHLREKSSSEFST